MIYFILNNQEMASFTYKWDYAANRLWTKGNGYWRIIVLLWREYYPGCGNTLCYPLQVLHKECMISQNPRDHNTRISYINSLNSSNAVSFDHVVVIPFRALSNLFHFAEGVNTIIRFVLQYKYPVIYNEWLYSVDSLRILVAWLWGAFLFRLVSWVLNDCAG